MAAGLPCFPCAGVIVDDPVGAAAALSAGWPIPDEARLDLVWTVVLDAPIDEVAVAAQAASVRAAGADPWLRLVFGVPSPLRDNGVRLAEELERAVAVARAVGSAEATFSVVREGTFDPAEYGFLLKRAAVAINGAAAHARIATTPLPSDPAVLRAFYGEDVSAYIDRIAMAPESDDASADLALATLSELDPGKPIVLEALPYPAAAASVWLAAAQAATKGFGTTLFRASPDVQGDLQPLKILAVDFAGDLAYDPSSNPSGGGSSFAFVRGDLGLRVVAEAPEGASTWALRFTDPGIRKITRLDPRTGLETGVGGRRIENGVEVKASGLGAALSLRLERASAAELGEVEGVQDRVEISGERTLPVEEILRRLQAFEDAQARRLKTLEATNSTSLRFGAGGGNSVDATFRGAYFQRTGEPADWAWQEFFLNGVKWRSKTLPEIPLVQPEKAAAMPLEILFTKEYRYTVRGTERLEDRDCWVVDFAPNGPADGKRLYQGTVWIDLKLSARVRTRAVQLGLEGDVLSNEETFFYQPLDGAGKATSWSSESFVLATRSVAQQLLSVVNQSTLVEKETRLENLLLNAEGFDSRRAAVFASESTMVRDTEAGLRYLVKDESGERVVKQGFDSSKLFLLGGVFYDDSLAYPLPIGGVNYLDLDFRKRGQQLNAFFAGALGIVNWADPSVAGSRFDAGANAFFFALPTEDQVFRDGDEVPAESVTSQVARVGLTVGRPVGSFFKWSANLGAEYRRYDDAEDTAKGFRIPSDGVTTSLGLEGKYARAGYVFSAAGALNQRSEWEPWGFVGNPEYDAEAKDYATWQVGVGKTWHLAGFKKFGADVVYVSGSDLDRFSKYEFGFFGDTRVHGFQTDRVRAAEAIATHVRYGFEVGELFRLDGILDAALATDERAGLDNELLAGVGIQGTFLGPWQTIVNVDVGVPIAGPDDGFALYIAFLKLFK